MKPIIGVTSTVEEPGETISKDNIRAISQAGGIPLVLSNSINEDV